MVRRPLIAIGAVALAVGCGARPAATIPRGAHVAARGTLGYAAAFSADALYTIELDDRFALFVRDPDTGALRQRIELGPAERDLPALAIADDGVAWIGGADHAVRAIAVATGQTIATWPIGASVTALAAVPGGGLVIGDATGVVCLRRRADGALLQCVVAGQGPVTALVRSGTAIVATTDGARLAFSLPALAVVDAGPPPPPSVVGRDVLHRGRAIVHFAGPARAVAYGPRGQLAAVGWIRRLDDPSVVVVPADRVQSGR